MDLVAISTQNKLSYFCQTPYHFQFKIQLARRSKIWKRIASWMALPSVIIKKVLKLQNVVYILRRKGQIKNWFPRKYLVLFNFISRLGTRRTYHIIFPQH